MAVILQPLDRLKHYSPVNLVDSIFTQAGLASQIAPSIKIPPQAYHQIRKQYNSKKILEHLNTLKPGDLKIIGLTMVDLYIPILKYVFGLAQIEGRAAVISLHRLSPEFYGNPPDAEILQARTEKTCIHELGHTYGLTHCRNKTCVMYSSVCIKDTDWKASSFCLTCLELYKWNSKKK